MSAPTVAPHRRGDRTIWPRWVLTHALYGALGPAVLKILEGRFLAGSATRATDGPSIVAGVTAAWLVLGGVVQWVILRRYLRPLGWWPIATIVGAFTGGLLVFGFVTGNYTYRETFRSDLLICGFTAAAIGTAQWIVLRRRIRGAGWWVAASVAGGALIWLTYTAVTATTFAGAAAARGVGQAAVVAVATQGGVSVAAYATVTALGLIWLLRRAGPAVAEGVRQEPSPRL